MTLTILNSNSLLFPNGRPPVLYTCSSGSLHGFQMGYMSPGPNLPTHCYSLTWHGDLHLLPVWYRQELLSSCHFSVGPHLQIQTCRGKKPQTTLFLKQFKRDWRNQLLLFRCNFLITSIKAGVSYLAWSGVWVLIGSQEKKRTEITSEKQFLLLNLGRVSIPFPNNLGLIHTSPVWSPLIELEFDCLEKLVCLGNCECIIKL